MRSMFKHTRRVLVCALALCAVSLGPSACVSSEEPTPIDWVESGSTTYDVTVTVGGRQISLDVQISAAMSESFREMNGRDLDRAAVEQLVAERLNRMIDEGSMELPADPDAMLSLVVDHQDMPMDTFLQEQGCVVHSGYSTESYYIYINDSLGCRYYYYTDYYDNFYNQCTSTASKVFLYSTYVGPTNCNK